MFGPTNDSPDTTPTARRAFSRRHLLAVAAGAGLTALAGCKAGPTGSGTAPTRGGGTPIGGAGGTAAASASTGATPPPRVVGTPAATSGEPRPQGGVRAVLDAFVGASIVALGEFHALQEVGDFYLALLHHPDLPGTVNDVVVEFGNARHQDLADRFVAGEPVADAALRRIWRDHTASVSTIWDAPMYEAVFRAVRAINRTLPAARHLRILLGDPQLDWGAVRGPDDFIPLLLQRDAHYAMVMEEEVLRRGRRALFLAGTAHVFRASNPGPPAGMAPGTPSPDAGGPGATPPSRDEGHNAVQRVERHYPGETHVIVPHVGFGARTSELEPRLADWPRQGLAPVAGTWLAGLGAGLLYSEGTMLRGPDGQPIDPYAGLTLGDMAHAYLFLGRRADLTASRPNPAIFRGDEAYLAELQRRQRATRGGDLDTASLYAERGPRFFGD
jgi:hypothetical protein